MEIDEVDRIVEKFKLEKSDIHEIILVGGSSRMPKVRKILEDFFDGKELCSSVNPDECVAYGAAIYAAILMRGRSEKLDDIVLMEALSFPLGIETSVSCAITDNVEPADDGIMSVIVKHNTTLPTMKTETFSTAIDDQSSVRVKVFEGENGRLSRTTY